MRILITGIDGYLGWSLTQHLASRGHTVGGADALLRRSWVDEMKSVSAIPIASMDERIAYFSEKFGKELFYRNGDLVNYEFVESLIKDFKPDAIVHLGECPSAPYSMIDAKHATWVQSNNVIGTMNIIFAIRELAPEIHLVKLGTMGEYGTPKIDIPEGFFEVEYRGKIDRLPFPRQAGSWYHWSKVHSSNNIMFACRMYGLRSTDIMQGVVYGTQIDTMTKDPRSLTRLDFDQCFGTAINRFSCQSVIGEPMTPFGKGQQRRGFLPLRDSMQCLTLVLEQPAELGEYRVINQFEECYNISDLALTVKSVANDLGLTAEIHNLENPRIELEEHVYNPDRNKLIELGYKPTHDMRAELQIMLKDLIEHQARIKKYKHALTPDIRWDGTKRKSGYL